MSRDILTYIPPKATIDGIMPGYYWCCRSQAEYREVLAHGARLADTDADWHAFESQIAYENELYL